MYNTSRSTQDQPIARESARHAARTTIGSIAAAGAVAALAYFGPTYMRQQEQAFDAEFQGLYQTIRAMPTEEKTVGVLDDLVDARVTSDVVVNAYRLAVECNNPGRFSGMNKINCDHPAYNSPVATLGKGIDGATLNVPNEKDFKAFLENVKKY